MEGIVYTQKEILLDGVDVYWAIKIITKLFCKATQLCLEMFCVCHQFFSYYILEADVQQMLQDS